MIAKWLQELETKGAIYDYRIGFDDVTQEYVVDYYETKTIPFLIIEFSIDPTTQEVVFKGDTNAC
jgi:hypothetical protein